MRSWFDSWVRKICWRRNSLPTPVFLGFPCGSAGKESAHNAGDMALIPGLGRSPGEGKGCPLQYSGLENSMDCIVHGVAKSWTQLSDFHSFFGFVCVWVCVCVCVYVFSPSHSLFWLGINLLPKPQGSCTRISVYYSLMHSRSIWKIFIHTFLGTSTYFFGAGNWCVRTNNLFGEDRVT